MKDLLLKKLLNYVKVNTQSNMDSMSEPSTPGQMDLARIIVDDLRQAGITDIELTDTGFIYATIPSNLPADAIEPPVLGFLAHLDTATEESGKNVMPQVIENYDGSDISYPNNPNLTLNKTTAPELAHSIGHTLVTSDGTTLLGGDDKAGLSIIIALATYYRDNPDHLHGSIRIGIIPDEEIGIGTNRFDIKKFNADIAYTIDGTGMGELDVESFNGFSGTITVTGNSVYPGYGKGTYINASQVLSQFISKMDDAMWPQYAQDRDPAWWIQKIDGSVGSASAHVFLRAFDLHDIDRQKNMLDDISNTVCEAFPGSHINIDISETYLNYGNKLAQDKRIVDFAKKAFVQNNIDVHEMSLRGGNDCCHLCDHGLLSTNLSAGYYNIHSLIEWVSIDAMLVSLKSTITLCDIWRDSAK